MKTDEEILEAILEFDDFVNVVRRDIIRVWNSTRRKTGSYMMPDFTE